MLRCTHTNGDVVNIMFIFCAVLLELVASVAAHVPVYGKSYCQHLAHHHSTSQAFYFIGNGGIEIPLQALDVAKSSEAYLDIDLVVKEKYSLERYEVFVGCGRCLQSLTYNGNRNIEYQEARLEPFTQTTYRSIFNDSAKKYFTRNLNDCAAGYFTIRLHEVNPDKSKLYWSAVVGKKEDFTAEELVLFPPLHCAKPWPSME